MPINCKCSYGLLEPRLIEYLKRKYNNNPSCVPLEKIYSITSGDMATINTFFKKHSFGCVSNDLIKPVNFIDIDASKDFMTDKIKKDLKENYLVHPAKAPYNYRLHYASLPEMRCSSENEKEVPLENEKNIDDYKKFVSKGLRDFTKPLNECVYSDVGKSQDGKRKTYGFMNPVDHYYYYINKDIQKPEHIILPFPRGGFLTRSLNHQYK